MGISPYLQRELLDHVLRGNVASTYYTRPTSVFLGLLTQGSEGDVGPEVVGGGYARQAVTFSAPDNSGRVANDTLISFGPAQSTWGTVVAGGVYDQAGVLLFDAFFPTPITLPVGRGLRFQPGDFGVDLESFTIVARDVTPPTVVITSPTVSQEIGGAFRVRGTTLDDSGAVDTVRVSAGALSNLIATQLQGTADWFCDVDTRLATGSVDGALTITAAALDASNNESTTTRAVWVKNAQADSVPPSVTIANLSNGETLTTARILTGSASDNIGVSTVEVQVGSNPRVPTTYNPSTGIWTHNFNPAAYVNGTYTVSVFGTDSAANVTTVTRTGIVFNTTTADVTAPTTTITNPVAPAQEVSSSPFIITGTASDNIEVDRVEVTFGGVVKTATLTGTQPDMNWELSQVTSNLTDQATYSISARAFDASNNVDASPATSSIKYVAPAPALYGPKAGYAQPSGSIVVNVGDNVQSKINSGGSGAKFWFRAGTHRVAGTWQPSASNQEFHGEYGSKVSGARNISVGQAGITWTQAGSVWRCSGASSTFIPVHSHSISSGTVSHRGNFYGYNSPTFYTDMKFQSSTFSDDVYYNGKPMKRMESVGAVVAGTYYIDYPSNTITIGSNPNGAVVELNAYGGPNHEDGFLLSGGASGIKLKNMTISNALCTGVKCGSNWNFEDTTVAYCSIAGVDTGSGLRMTNCRVHWNGQFGLRGGGSNITFTNCEWSYNNYHCVQRNSTGDALWSAGANKFGNVAGMLVDRVYAHHNWGDGIWFDGAAPGPASGVTIQNCVMENNMRRGVNSESQLFGAGNDWLITNSTFRYNGGAGIWINGASGQSSANPNVISFCKVYNNDIDPKQTKSGGISFVMQGNIEGVRYWDVHDNELSQSSSGGMRAGYTGSTTSTTGVIFRNNRYHVTSTSGNYWVWGGVEKNFTAWRAIHGGDTFIDSNTLAAGTQGVTCRCDPTVAPCPESVR